MKRYLLCIPCFLVLLIAISVSSHANVQSANRIASGTDAFVLDLNNPDTRLAIENQGGLITNEGPDGEFSFYCPVSNAIATPVRSNTITFPLDASSLRGSKVALFAQVRGENIQSPDSSTPLPHHHGGKVQIVIESPSAGKIWLDSSPLHGTFDWSDISMLGGIPTDATSVILRVGLERAAGSLWLTQLRLHVVRTLAARPEPTPAVRDAVASAQTTRRGVMSSHQFSTKDFDDLAAWNVNVIRWQMYQQRNDTTPYDQWIAAKLDDLAFALDAAAARGMQLAVDLHSPPGDRTPDRTHRMYLEKEYADKFVALWEGIASRFKGHPGLWAYNLVNEPVQNTPSPPGLDDWLGLQTRAAKAIRAIDPDTPIMIETDQWSSPGTYAWLQPIDVPGIIYQPHMYWPGQYTHQGVRTDQGIADQKDFDRQKIAYPGTLNGAPFDRDALRRHLQPVRDFQLATGAPIYIGEFSTVRWAPGGAQYLDDLISIFEEYGWDWTYHAFREWPGWSVEHADLPYDRNNHIKSPADNPSERQKVLLKWFSKNKSVH